MLGNDHQALHFLWLALEVARGSKNALMEINSLSNLGTVYLRIKKYGDCVRAFNEALEISKLVGDYPSQGASLGRLAEAYAGMGRFSDAVEVEERALEIHRTVGALAEEAETLANLGHFHQSGGSLWQSSRYYIAAAGKMDETRNLKGVGVCLAGASTTLFLQDLLEDAIKLAVDGLKAAVALGDTGLKFQFLSTLACSYRNAGQFDLAVGYFMDASALCPDEHPDIKAGLEQEAEKLRGMSKL